MKKLTKKDIEKMDKHDLQELTLMCLAVMKERTGFDIRKIGEDAVKTPRIKKYLKKAQFSTMPTFWFIMALLFLLIVFIVAVPPEYRLLLLGD